MRDKEKLDLRGLVDLCLLPEPSAAAGRRLGDYELLEKIGSGGMGSVWRAWQAGLQREVAVKILHDDLAKEVAFTSAFRQEAELTATLKHPGIVAVYESGECDGVWFYAMEWVDADNLEDVLREHGTRPVRDAVVSVRDAAVSVGHAHGKGVLHRDLKPSNILIDATGHVRVLDFGLAKLAGPVASGRTAPLLGTPHYVAPEQAAGAASGPAADVYSLGAMLYRMLCGRPPFAGETALEVIDQARRELPIPPRRLNASVPADVEVMVLKCLEKEPSLRYRDASALAADLTNWLDGKPVKARPVGPLGQLRRWVRRAPFQAALAAVLLLGAAGTWWQFSEASHLRTVATRDREMAALQRSATTLREGHRSEAIRIFSNTLKDQAVERWGFPARRLREDLSGRKIYQEITAHQDKIWGMTLADHGDALITCSEDGMVAVREAATGELRFAKPVVGGVPFGLCAYPDDGKILVTCMAGETRILDLPSREWQPGPDGLTASLATRTSDGKWWATLDGNPHFWTGEGSIQLWKDHPGGVPSRSFPGKRAAFSPDGKLLAIGRSAPDLRLDKSGGAGLLVEIFQTETGEKADELITQDTVSTVRSLAWSADSRQLAVAEGNLIHTWKPGTTRPLWTRRLPAGVWQVIFAGDKLLAACSDQAWRVLDAADGEQLQSKEGHRNEIWCLQILKDGRIASGDKSGKLLIWPGLDDANSNVPADSACHACFSAEGDLLTLDGGKLRVTRPGGSSRLLETPNATSFLGWDLTRRAAVACGEGGRLLWLDPQSGQVIHELRRLPGETPEDFSAATIGLSHGGGFFYECTSAGVFLRNSESGETIRQFSPTPPPFITSALSADDHFLVIGSSRETRQARLYDLKTGKIQLLSHARDEVLASAFSPDNRWLATGGGESSVYIWDLTGNLSQPTAVLEGHLESVNGLAFTPDGQWLVSAGSGESLRFWLCKTWEPGPAFPCPPGNGFITFSPDGRWLGVSEKSGKNQRLRLLSAP